jgi:glycosyltransferase involved in cell wall biosynthesis
MISVVILTKNEAENLPRCLDSVKFSDDVLVLDSGSTDDTCAIAQTRGARVMTRPFDSFGRQRNYAMEAGGLRHDWVLHLDADEVVTPELKSELQRIATVGATLPAFRIPARMILMDTWLRHAGMYPAYQVRFGRRELLRFVDHGHGQREALPPELVGTIDAPFDHYNFSKGLEDWYARHRRYAAAEAEQAMAERIEPLRPAKLLSFDRTERRRALKRLGNRLPFRPQLRFAYTYFLCGGFLDGRAGLRYSGMLATYQGYIDARMRELIQQRGNGKAT